jgi:hypothetical protein
MVKPMKPGWSSFIKILKDMESKLPEFDTYPLELLYSALQDGEVYYYKGRYWVVLGKEWYGDLFEYLFDDDPALGMMTPKVKEEWFG